MTAPLRSDCRDPDGPFSGSKVVSVAGLGRVGEIWLRVASERRGRPALSTTCRRRHAF